MNHFLSHSARTAGRPVSRWVLLRLAAILACMFACLPHMAWAQSVNCPGTAQTITVSMPASITVPRDAPNGTILTSWVTTAATTNYYTCTVVTTSNVLPASGMSFQPLSVTKSGMTVMGPNNVAYTVWKTNLPGIGVAIGIHTYANACGWWPWLDLGGAGGYPYSPWHGSACSVPTKPVTNGGQAQVALVKIGAVTAGTVTGGVLFEGASTTSMDINGSFTIATTGRKSFSLTPTVVNVAACTTPNVTVNMGTYKQSTFTGAGSSTPAVAFKVNVNACPAGLKSIQYQFIPVSAVLDASNGVLALSSDSTAAGIGLQLKDGSGKALKYNTQYTLASYDSTTGGAYTIPLTAAYYQTSATVTPGSANANLTFTMTYQ